MSILGNHGKVKVLLRLCLVLSVALTGILCRAVELTDFREPHPWNPRTWHVNAGTFADGTWTLDFANRPHADLMSSIDIPVSPKRFLVDVEADAEAAGTRLTIWTVSGGWVSRDFGTIAAASNGAKTVRQTFAIDADLTKDWKWASNGRTINPKWSRMPRPSRFLGFHVFRNTCRAAHPKIRFLSVRVEGWPENSAPEVRLVPPRGDEPPRQLGAYVVNAATNDLSEGTLQVAVEDWDGHAAGTVTANIRNLKGGESRYVTLDLPPCPSDKNYLRYRSTWLEDGVRKAGVLPFETSWTRPVTSEGTCDLRPELPWGMNLVLARNQPFDCFSGYEPAFDEAAFARMEQKAELARKAGVKWDRFEIQPPFLRPTKDQWNWELYDRIVDVLNRNGISGFGLVCGFPKWVKPYTEDAYRVYCETLQAIVRRYRGKMHGWEIWNEPNIHFWTGPKEEYFKLQDRAFGAVREVDPTVPVIGLSAASTPEMYDFAKKFFASGARYTEISVHTYRTGFNEGAFLDELKMLSDMGKGTRLWISEMGWTTGGNVMQTADEHAQAAYLARVYLAVAGSPHAAVMNWYDFVDDGFNFNYSEENFGILRRDLTPKPAYRAMAQIGNLFTQGKPALRKVPLAAGFALWTFTMVGKSVVWTDSEQPVKAKVVLSGEAEVSNLMGEPLGRANGGAVYSLDGEHPLFFSCEVTSVEQVKSPRKSGDIRVDFDFSDGKTNGTWKRIESAKWPLWAKTVSFEADAQAGVKLMLQAKDATGQGIVVDFPVRSPGRRRYVADLTKCTRHWFGADDGFPHYPLTSLQYHVEAIHRNRKGGVFGHVDFSEPTFEDWPESLRGRLPGKAAEADGAPLVLSTFDEPTAFNPRRWKGHGCTITNGVVSVDFAKNPNAEIVNGFHIPIVPRAFRLTVEAPAEAAGTRFGLMPTFNTGGTLYGVFGKLAKPTDGASTIRQTLELTGAMTNAIWTGAGGSAKFNRHVLPYPSRVWGLTIQKGDAPREKFDLRLVSLEAVGPAGQARPYLRALPPTDADVPTKLKVRLESALPAAISPELKVTVRDWDGRVVADFVSVVKDLRSGERRIAEIDLPKLPADRNYFQFLVRNDLVESETSWTRPLADEGTRDLRPDLPWGMNVCVYRNADPTCFGHAASDDEASPAGWQRMEERAALARRCGIKWDRMEVSVKRIRPNRDTWDWEFTDRMVDALHRNGISIFGDLMWFPKWTKWFTGEAYGEYFKVVRAAAQRYRGKVLGWEIWNEPNIHFWKGTQFEYFNLITQSFYRIREVDEDVPVIGLSLSGVDVDYAKAFSGRWWERFTDFSFHTYRAELDEDLFLDDIRKMSAAGKACPVWLSEMGWSTGGQAMQTCGEHDQASRLAREYMTAAGSGRVRAVCAYDFVDDGFNADYSEDSFGVLRRDLTPKPSSRALASVFRSFTSGKGKLERHLLDGGIKLWIFRMGDRAAAWTDSATPVSVTFRADGPVKAINLMGEPLSEGVDTVTVSLDIAHPVLFSRSRIVLHAPRVQWGDGEGAVATQNRLSRNRVTH